MKKPKQVRDMKVTIGPGGVIELLHPDMAGRVMPRKVSAAAASLTITGTESADGKRIIFPTYNGFVISYEGPKGLWKYWDDAVVTHVRRLRDGRWEEISNDKK